VPLQRQKGTIVGLDSHVLKVTHTCETALANLSNICLLCCAIAEQSLCYATAKALKKNAHNLLQAAFCMHRPTSLQLLQLCCPCHMHPQVMLLPKPQGFYQTEALITGGWVVIVVLITASPSVILDY
jgi:hypothetical protein